MDRHRIVLKIAELRSYIASDWPSIEERGRLYRAIEEMEKSLRSSDEKEIQDKSEET